MYENDILKSSVFWKIWWLELENLVPLLYFWGWSLDSRNRLWPRSHLKGDEH